jgi:hypothetical protein
MYKYYPLKMKLLLLLFGKRCFGYNGVVFWNNRPYEAKTTVSISSFKNDSETNDELKPARLFLSFVFLLYHVESIPL